MPQRPETDSQAPTYIYTYNGNVGWSGWLGGEDQHVKSRNREKRRLREMKEQMVRWGSRAAFAKNVNNYMG